MIFLTSHFVGIFIFVTFAAAAILSLPAGSAEARSTRARWVAIVMLVIIVPLTILFFATGGVP